MSGWPIQQTSNTILNVGTVAAAGTTLATGTAIDSSLYYVINVTDADGTKGVTLPVPVSGMDFILYNNSASNLKVYPHSGGNVNGGSTDAAVTVASKVWARFTAISGVIWTAMYTAGGTYATLTGSETLSNKTLASPIITGVISAPGVDEVKISTAITFTSDTTLASITGLTGFTLTASGVYQVEIHLPMTQTTNGGSAVAIKLTTATLTEVNLSVVQTAASTMLGPAVFTTTTDAAKIVDNKTAATTLTRITGTITVGTGGTCAIQGAQNTSAGGGDVTTFLGGGYARFRRIS